jgi:hypothetical protein
MAILGHLFREVGLSVLSPEMQTATRSVPGILPRDASTWPLRVTSYRQKPV